MRLQHAIEQYLTLKQSLGFRYRSESKVLKAFGRAMGRINAGQAKPKAVRAFLDGGGAVTRNWICKWTTLRGFYQFAMARRLALRSPLPERAPKVVQSFTPYIYSQQELQRLLQVITPKRTKGVSADTIRTMVLLLYGAGLRLSEALNLEEANVDLGERLLCVRCSKFFKTRWVPIGPKLTQVLADYQHREPSAVGASNRRFFRTVKGSPVRSATLTRPAPLGCRPSSGSLVSRRYRCAGAIDPALHLLGTCQLGGHPEVSDVDPRVGCASHRSFRSLCLGR